VRGGGERAYWRGHDACTAVSGKRTQSKIVKFVNSYLIDDKLIKAFTAYVALDCTLIAPKDGTTQGAKMCPLPVHPPTCTLVPRVEKKRTLQLSFLLCIYFGTQKQTRNPQKEKAATAHTLSTA
jgi:hypothetical protein